MDSDKEHPADTADTVRRLPKLGEDEGIPLDDEAVKQALKVATALRNELDDRRANLEGLTSELSGDFVFLDQRDPSIRSKMIDLLKREIAALQAVDAQEATLDDVYSICDSFKKQHDSLNPNKQ
jgi:hypothetical protein